MLPGQSYSHQGLHDTRVNPLDVFGVELIEFMKESAHKHRDIFLAFGSTVGW
jgi:hypothetical protein